MWNISIIWVAYEQITQNVREKLKLGFSWQKQVSTKKTLFTGKLDFNLRKKIVKGNTWNIILYGTENCKLREVDQKYLGSFDMLCWRRLEKISWIDRVQNEKV
jgi:hypothetical protein